MPSAAGSKSCQGVRHAECLERHAADVRKMAALEPADAGLVDRFSRLADAAEAGSLARFGLEPQAALVTADAKSSAAPPQATGSLVYRRKAQPKGPMSGFGYSWLDDRLEKTGIARPALLDRDGPRDAASYAYEALNLVDGHRSVQEIRDFLSATIAPVPVETVAEFLATLEKVGLLERQ